MSNLELRPEWFLSTSSLNTGQGLLHNDNEQTIVGGRPWPRVQAHAVNELAKKRSVGSVALAVEFWEKASSRVEDTEARRWERLLDGGLGSGRDHPWNGLDPQIYSRLSASGH